MSRGLALGSFRAESFSAESFGAESILLSGTAWAT
ncbi:hypothetical protein Pla22_29360 [Rubripirellula amarantea]|uniref:Uncharacterized protein n=1 Tax=Rubripirellula amarantea TaxID=2527999 RepID=A0A5C5WJA0_9BACT|nr:hypothetical protein Pla22_29360 [Rubripirellula amarantea]